MPFITDHFLLESKMARRLYHEVAAEQAIIDYHNHLPPADVAANRQFGNLFEIWLEGDHYKWRAMRSNGIAEKHITGDASPYDKFMAFAATMPHTLRNPLFHWSALELKRCFGIDEILTPATAPEIWKKANKRLAKADRSVHGILKSFKVEVICTTDDPADSLEHHAVVRESDCPAKMFPAFRPDALLKIDQPECFNASVQRLGKAAAVDTGTLAGLEKAIIRRHEFFHQMGCRLSDHGLAQVPAAFATDRQVAAVYAAARAGKAITPEQREQFATWVMLLTGRLDAAKGWVQQLHVGALRSSNSKALRGIGADAGFDSIGDLSQADRLARYLDALDADGQLPKTILYNLNPADNYMFAAMCGNFMDGKTPGKVQYGSGWWFLDQRDGMEWQINALSNLGLLSHWVGMLTDSRSFMSFSRHEYFRRIFCNLLGEDVRRGALPDDFKLLADLVQRVCYGNARRYFEFLTLNKPSLA